jgi:formamidopyrimidine-DNA glycosylase
MPELPEVEVIRLFLEANLIGKTISKFEIITPKSFIGETELVEGQKITKFSRVGKQLSLHLKNGLILLFHLKMTGQIIMGDSVLGHPTPKEDKSILPNKSTRLIFTFSDKSKLFFNDQRKFGWVKLLNQAELAEAQKNLGFDILNPKFTSNYLYQQLKTSSRPIKAVLLDQSKFAGIGNIYANDSLFLAKIHPNTPSNKINLKKAVLLHQFLVQIMKNSIKSGGSTAKDNKYIHPDGSSGHHQFNFQVYQRDKKPCLICQTPIKKVKIGGRGTFFCPKCQKIIR